eukprot:TRINITY_DN40317_c0_g1_i2.p1 TRINITY_DN40317_c0_g1~~TRINITY_DN40317_c0_g1_i2.p1  ORF type:complete len:503 (-),score=108.69 TRINITY_DN40317_c0_g1_i2:50-1558(-)
MGGCPGYVRRGGAVSPPHVASGEYLSGPGPCALEWAPPGGDGFGRPGGDSLGSRAVDYDLSSVVPPQTQVQHHTATVGNNRLQRWHEAYFDLQQEKRDIQAEAKSASEESAALKREAQGLREEIQAERARREEKVFELKQQVEDMERESKQLNMKLIKSKMQDSAKLSDVAMVKKEVVARTMELEKILREFQQTYQDKLFARITSITSAMASVCHKPDVRIQTPAGTEESLASPGVELLSTTTAPTAANARGVSDQLVTNGTFLDPETQQALKRRLQSLGDVVVYASDKYEACCASGRAIPPNSLRVRPRRCDHVFLIECIMPYWAEGICPVCRCSFAYDRPQDAGFDESDRYSSVSTSVSQMHRQSAHSNTCSDAGSLRGPRGLRGSLGSAANDNARGRSASLNRGQRRRRSPGGGHAGGGNGGSGGHGGGEANMRGPSRGPPSAAGSRASSVPRDLGYSTGGGGGGGRGGGGGGGSDGGGATTSGKAMVQHSPATSNRPL